MRDIYPLLDTIAPADLVAPGLQPEYPDEVAFTTLPLAEALADRWAVSNPASVAVIHHEAGTSLTYLELAELSRRLANVLVAHGVRPGHRVAFRTANRPEAIITALASWRIGAVVVPVPIQARAAEITFFLSDVDAYLLVADVRGAWADEVATGIEGTTVQHVIGFADGAQHPFLDWDSLLAGASDADDHAAPDPDGVGLIWHTGGSTGRPKGCYHTQRRFLYGGYAVGAATGVAPGERWAAAAPVGHALGFIYHTIFTLMHGATVVMVEQFGRPEVMLGAIDQHDVHTFTSVLATWARLRDVIESDPGAGSAASLRRAFAMWQSASSSSVREWWAARGVRLVNNYGSTSFATWVLVPQAGDPDGPAVLGHASPGYFVIASDLESGEVRPVVSGEAGRMAVRGPSGLTYWRRPDLQRRDVIDGWTMADDLISFDRHGSASYLGRTDHMISTAGFKVAPAEVEEVLARHPAVREVAVVSAPDAIRQEIVAAFVVVAGVRADDGLRKELQNLVKRELSPYKYPRRIEFLEALPRDDVGKVQSKLLVFPEAVA